MGIAKVRMARGVLEFVTATPTVWNRASSLPTASDAVIYMSHRQLDTNTVKMYTANGQCSIPGKRQ